MRTTPCKTFLVCCFTFLSKVESAILTLLLNSQVSKRLDELQREYEKRNIGSILHGGSTSKSVEVDENLNKLLDKSVMKKQSRDIEEPTFTQGEKDDDINT